MLQNKTLAVLKFLKVATAEKGTKTTINDLTGNGFVKNFLLIFINLLFGNRREALFFEKKHKKNPGIPTRVFNLLIVVDLNGDGCASLQSKIISPLQNLRRLLRHRCFRLVHHHLAVVAGR